MKILDKEIQIDYQNRINRVFQYIDENLDSDLSLNTISDIAFFSPYHFHRIFKFITEETLNEYVTRRRIEKSALDLIHKNVGISEISLKCGFNDNSSFTRAFKKYYGISPTEFRKQNPNKFSKIRQLESKNGQEYPDYDKYICVINNLKIWIKMNAKIEIKEMPKMELAYVSSIGPQNLGNAYQKLMQWTTPKGLMNEQTKMVTIYHDSFKVTEANKVRMSACILLNQSVETDGEIGLTSIKEGKFIVGSFEIGLNEFEKSWTGLFIWMNENGYKKGEGNPFEIYHNNLNEHPQKKAIVDFCIPIE
ncbi:AraC family transcriptional regulator [Nonlabens xylanidelens]|uniref:AraC family transcriptional regulator n=1 Tax=Nonlabens xylanidelens TaxID=191564 RepID=A0A2S6II77_9FLAO|nr:AraC family transcriptional regulator [Nonlabens xylanidelens]PPK93923.1 AraC family transcriptional regulator [Nonlabens xylanidelens]PQJ22079.1 AraC family transcriptional regulator [Nonlabens xylanidelens]